MEKVILVWFLICYTALSGYSFLYAVTVKPEERSLQGPIQKMLYYNAVFVTGLLFAGAVSGLVFIGAAALLRVAF